MNWKVAEEICLLFMQWMSLILLSSWWQIILLNSSYNIITSAEFCSLLLKLNNPLRCKWGTVQWYCCWTHAFELGIFLILMYLEFWQMWSFWNIGKHWNIEGHCKNQTLLWKAWCCWNGHFCCLWFRPFQLDFVQSIKYS